MKIAAVTRAVRWMCYADQKDARNVFDKLRDATLAGPGEIQLRHNPKVPYGWWVVLYDIVFSTTHEMAKIYGFPAPISVDSWFEYEGPHKIRQNNRISRLVDSFIVECSEEKLVNAKKLMPRAGVYACPDPSISISCPVEIANRQRLLKLRGSLEYEPLSLYS